jgi:serine protease Do
VLADQLVVAQPPSREATVRDVQQKVVKVYGAGGLAGLEAYQSGCLVSPEGHVATAWSYVLDVDPTVVLDDGRRFEATIVGFEPKLELAVLKIDAVDLPFFRMTDEVVVEPGAAVLAFSNLFSIATGNEPASVMRGFIASEATLEARRGTFKTAYTGPVYMLDLVANNPGAAGGALVDVRGQLLGMLGKELRDDRTGVWINYAVPTKVLRKAIADIVAGRVSTEGETSEVVLSLEQAHSYATLGLVMVPDVLEKTPAYIDSVRATTLAAKAGLQSDDLILLAAGKRVDSQQTLQSILRTIDKRDPVSLTVQRGIEILTFTLQP